MIINSFLNERENKILWAPVLIGSGIILPYSSKITFALLAFILIISVIFRSKNFIAAILLIIVGVVAINVCTYTLNTKFIDKPMYIHKGIATIYEINHKIGHTQLILKSVKHFKLKGVSKIRIKVYKLAESIRSGDVVLFSAKLTPPPVAVAPYSYDFARFAYFDGISAVGFATAPIILHSKQATTLLSIVDPLRNYITKSFVDIMGQKNGNIAAALIVGKRQGIDKNIVENIRKAGLAHLLAISGLHLTIVTFFFFVLFRKLFALSIFVATRCNIKRWAAIAGMVASPFY